MVLLENKHFFFTRKGILISLLSTCIILSGCDKKSERRRAAKKAEGSTEHVTKDGAAGDMPCIPAQQPGQVDPNNPNSQNNPNNGQNQNNPNANTNAINGQQNLANSGLTADPNSQVNNQNPQGTAQPQNQQKPQVNNGQVPCVPGQSNTTSNNGTTATPGSADPSNNSNPATLQPGAASQVTIQPNGTGNSSVTGTPGNSNQQNPNLISPDGRRGVVTDGQQQTNPSDPLSQNDPRSKLNGLSDGRSDHQRTDLSHLDMKDTDDRDSRTDRRRSDRWDDEDEERDRKGDKEKIKDSKISRRIKTLRLILQELNNFYKNAMWAVTEDRYNTADNFFGQLDRVIGKKKLFIKRNGEYLDESKDHSCSGTALELEIGSKHQKLFVYDCQREQTRYDEEPLLEFVNESRKWVLRTNIHGLAQIMGEEKLGYINTIDLNASDNKIPFKPKCIVKLSEDEAVDSDDIKVKSAICNYWGQRYSSSGRRAETIMFEEFNYNSEKDMQFKVRARKIDFDNGNQICVKNQIERTADEYDPHIHIKDDMDESDECAKANRELESEAARMNLQNKNQLVATPSPANTQAPVQSPALSPAPVIPSPLSPVTPEGQVYSGNEALGQQQQTVPQSLFVNQASAQNENIESNNQNQAGYGRMNSVTTYIDENGVEMTVVTPMNSVNPNVPPPVAVKNPQRMGDYRNNPYPNDNRNNGQNYFPENNGVGSEQQIDFSSQSPR